MTAVVIGVGAVDRGDDAVGATIAEEVHRRAPAGVRVACSSSPSSLLDEWTADDEVVVIDAVRTGRTAGDITVHAVGDSPLPVRSGAAGTHGFGVAEAIELARALHRLPRRLVVVGIEAARFTPGAPLSADVRSSVPAAVQTVLDVLSDGGLIQDLRT